MTNLLACLECSSLPTHHSRAESAAAGDSSSFHPTHTHTHTAGAASYKEQDAPTSYLLALAFRSAIVSQSKLVLVPTPVLSFFPPSLPWNALALRRQHIWWWTSDPDTLATRLSASGYTRTWLLRYTGCGGLRISPTTTR